MELFMGQKFNIDNEGVNELEMIFSPQFFRLAGKWEPIPSQSSFWDSVKEHKSQLQPLTKCYPHQTLVWV